ncbi:hypothetical protein BC828DRAFT_406740 [Blastocladiella britannica]|nr:hypothetical protein BC828DRAFT_406740 [Blastocladiella britannica]
MASPDPRILLALGTRLADKFPLPSSGILVHGAEAALDKEAHAALLALLAYSSGDDVAGSTVVTAVLNLCIAAHQAQLALEASDPRRADNAASLVAVLDILADTLFARWYPPTQTHLLPIPTIQPPPLDSTATGDLLSLLRAVIPLAGDLRAATLTSAVPILAHICVRSPVSITGRFATDYLPGSLLHAAGRCIFALSASNPREVWANGPGALIAAMGAPVVTNNHDNRSGPLSKLMQGTMSGAGGGTGSVDLDDGGDTESVHTNNSGSTLPVAPSIMSNATGTPGATSGTGDMTLDLAVFMATWSLWNPCRIRDLVRDVASRIARTYKRDKRITNAVLAIVHHSVWTWIVFDREGFSNMITAAASSGGSSSIGGSGNPTPLGATASGVGGSGTGSMASLSASMPSIAVGDGYGDASTADALKYLPSELLSLFDILESAADVKKKPVMWPVALTCLIMNPDKMLAIKAGSTSGDRMDERRIKFVQHIQKHFKNTKLVVDSGLAGIVVDVLKMQVTLQASYAKTYLAWLTEEIARVAGPLVGDAIAAAETPDAVPESVVIEIIVQLLQTQGGAYVDKYRNSCSHVLRALAFMCQAVDRISKKHGQKPFNADLCRAFKEYFRPFLEMLTTDTPRARSNTVATPVMASPGKKNVKVKAGEGPLVQEWTADDIPALELLACYRHAPWLADDRAALHVIYTAIMNGDRACQRHAVGALLRLSAVVTREEVANRISEHFDELASIGGRVADPAAAGVVLDLISDMFTMHRALRRVTAANASGVAATTASLSTMAAAAAAAAGTTQGHLHGIAPPTAHDYFLSAMALGARPGGALRPLQQAQSVDWVRIHKNLEPTVVVSQLARSKFVRHRAQTCLTSILAWNREVAVISPYSALPSAVSEPLFGTAENRSVYATWVGDPSNQVLFGSCLSLSATESVEAARELALLRLDESRDDTFASFMFATPALASSEVLARSIHSGHYAVAVAPSVFSHVHSTNLNSAVTVLASQIRLADDEGLFVHMRALASYNQEAINSSLTPIITALLSKVGDIHATDVLELAWRLFASVWWDGAMLELVVGRILVWVEIPVHRPACIRFMEKLCTVSRLYRPQSPESRTQFQQLLPLLLSTPKLAALALRHDHVADYFVALSRARLPLPWALPILEGRNAAPQPKASDLLCESVMLALNAAINVADLDEVASAVFGIAWAEDKEVEITHWLTGAELAVISQPQTFLRSNSLTVKLASIAVKQWGEGLLAAMYAVLAKMPDEVLDPNNAADTEWVAKLETMCDAVMTTVLSSLHHVQPRLRSVFKATADATAAKFPSYRLIGVGNLIFLRLLCPGIMAAPVALNQRSRTLIAKVIQNTVNGVLFGGKEEGMSPMNGWVSRYLDKVTPFLAELCVTESLPRSLTPTTTLTSSPSGLPIVTGSTLRQSSTSSSVHASATVPNTLEKGVARFIAVLHKHREAIAQSLTPAQRRDFYTVLLSIPVVETQVAAAIDPAALPPALCHTVSLTSMLPSSVGWFYRSGTTKSGLSLYTLQLQSIPLSTPAAAILETLYHEIRHAGSVPISLLIDAAFSVPSTSLATVVQTFLSDCTLILSKIYVLYCTEQLLAILDTVQNLPAVTMLGKLDSRPDPKAEARIEGLVDFPLDALQPLRRKLLVEFAKCPFQQTAAPLGHIQVFEDFVHLLRSVKGKTVHELYHVSELGIARYGIVRGVLVNDQGMRLASSIGVDGTGESLENQLSQLLIYVPRNLRSIVVRSTIAPRTGLASSGTTAVDTVHEHIASRQAASPTPDVDAVRTIHTSRIGEDHPALYLYQVLLSGRINPSASSGGSGGTATGPKAQIPEHVWSTVASELCAHLLLARDPREKLQVIERLCDAVVSVVPPSAWVNSLVHASLYLSCADPAIGEILQRQIARCPSSGAVMEELFRLMCENNHAFEYEMFVESVLASHIRYASSVNEHTYERHSSALMPLFRQPGPSVARSLSQQSRLLRTALMVATNALTTPSASLVWVLFVTSQTKELHEDIRSDLNSFLWFGREVGDWSAFAPLFGELAAMAREHVSLDSVAFIPALKMLTYICHATSTTTAVTTGQATAEATVTKNTLADESVLDAAISILRDRALGSANSETPPPVHELVEALSTLILQPQHQAVDFTPGQLSRIAMVSIALIGIYGRPGNPDMSPSSALSESPISLMQAVSDDDDQLDFADERAQQDPRRRFIQASLELGKAAMAALGQLATASPPATRTLEDLVLTESGDLAAELDRVFGVSLTAHFSISVGVMLSRLAPEYRALMEPLIRLLLAQAASQTAATCTVSPIEDEHAGFLLPMLGSRTLTSQLFPMQLRQGGVRAVLSRVRMSTASKLLVLAHVIQMLDRATMNGNATKARWILDWMEALHADSPALFALFLDPIAESTARLLAATRDVAASSLGSQYSSLLYLSGLSSARPMSPASALSAPPVLHSAGSLSHNSSRTGTAPNAGLEVQIPSGNNPSMSAGSGTFTVSTMSPAVARAMRDPMVRMCALLTTLLEDVAIVSKARALRTVVTAPQLPLSAGQTLSRSRSPSQPPPPSVTTTADQSNGIPFQRLQQQSQQQRSTNLSGVLEHLQFPSLSNAFHPPVSPMMQSPTPSKMAWTGTVDGAVSRGQLLSSILDTVVAAKRGGGRAEI